MTFVIVALRLYNAGVPPPVYYARKRQNRRLFKQQMNLNRASENGIAFFLSATQKLVDVILICCLRGTGNGKIKMSIVLTCLL